MSLQKKGTFTFRTAAVFFLLSAVLEVFSLSAEAPLFGAVRGGVWAVGYHLIYVVLFVVMGIGLWNAKPWGYRAVLASTIYYTLDKVQLLLSPELMETFFVQQLADYEDIFLTVDKASLLQMLTLVSVVFLICWWGFAWYTHVRRDYFCASGVLRD